MKKLLALLLVCSGFAIAQEAHSATLTWTPNPANPSGTTYNLWRLAGTCPSPAPSSTPPASFTQVNTSAITGTTFTDTSVMAATEYVYVLTSADSNGQSAPSPCSAAMTIPGAYWVTGLTATNSGATIVLSWMDSANPSGTTYFAWRLSGSCPPTAPTSTPPSGFAQLNTTAISGLTYTDSAVSPGDSYCYTVTAQGASGPQSIPSNTSGATVPAAFPVSSLGISVK